MARAKKEKPQQPMTPSLVIEYHYKDGDVGAHPATGAEAKLFQGFSRRSDGGYLPSHILLRADSIEGQELSDLLYKTAVRFFKNKYLADVKEALHQIEQVKQ